MLGIYTANEGPVRIQYKFLVPTYVFLEMKLCCLLISKTDLWCSVYQFLHSSICESFKYFQERSVYFAAAKYVDPSWEYINRSQTHECGNWDWGRAIPRKGIKKLDLNTLNSCTISPMCSFSDILQLFCLLLCIKNHFCHTSDTETLVTSLFTKRMRQLLFPRTVRVLWICTFKNQFRFLRVNDNHCTHLVI